MQSMKWTFPETQTSSELMSATQVLNMRLRNVQKFPKYSKKFTNKLKKNGIIFETEETIKNLLDFLMPFIMRDLDKLLESYLDLYFLPACRNIEENLGAKVVQSDLYLKIKENILNKISSTYQSNLSSTSAVETQPSSDQSKVNEKPKDPQVIPKRSKRKPVPKLKDLQSIPHFGQKTPTAFPFSPKSPYAKSHHTRMIISRQSLRYKKLAYIKNSLGNKRKDDESNGLLENGLGQTTELYDFAGFSDFIQTDPANQFDPDDPLVDINPSLHLFQSTRPDSEIIKSNDIPQSSNQKTFSMAKDTKFILGSAANIWLGLGAARGRIYSKYPELFRYQCDKDDKCWLVEDGLLDNHRVRAYLMLNCEVEHLRSRVMPDHSSKNKEHPQTFTVPDWLMEKISNAFLNQRQPSSESRQFQVQKETDQSTDNNTASLVNSPLTDFDMENENKTVLNFQPINQLIKMQ